MAKQTTTTVITTCDICNSEDNCYDSCRGCDKDICYNCTKVGRAVRYSHSVHFQGSGDGYYCRPCDLLAGNGDAAWQLYQKVKVLKDEAVAFNIGFETRRKAAEAELNKMVRG